MDDQRLVLVENVEDVNNMLAWLSERRDWLAVDIETTGLNVGRDRIRLVQFGDERTGFAVPYEDWRGAIREVIARYDRPMVLHNALFDTKFLKRDGIALPQHLVHDTMVMAHLYDPTKSIGLKPAAARHVGKHAWAGKNALRDAMSKHGWSFATVPVDHPAYWQYSALDTVLTAQLAGKLWPKVAQYREVYELELGSIHVLRDAELTGMAIDLDYVDAKSNELRQEIAELLPQLPEGLNPGSEPQVVKFLLSRGAVLVKKTEKGNPSIDDEVLESLKASIPEAGIIQRFRSASKLLSSYFDNFMEMHVGGVLRPSVKPVGARTGRMSITAPALQTLPRGPVVRDAFVARDGASLVSADYKQVELRVMASYANEQDMIEFFKRAGSDADLHTFTAQQVYRTDEPTNQQRQIAKNVNFANIYGAGIDKMAATAGVTTEIAKDFMEKYDAMFPGVEQFKQEVISKVQQRAREANDSYGWITTVAGRRLPVEANKAYKGVNYLVQSSATADTLKRKLVELDSAGLGDFIRLPVHDEIIFEVPDDQLTDAIQTIHEVMPDREHFQVPLEIDVNIAKRWGEAK